PFAGRQHHLADAFVAHHLVAVQSLQAPGRSPIAVGQHRLPQRPRSKGGTHLSVRRQLQHLIQQVHCLARLAVHIASTAKSDVEPKDGLQSARLLVPHAETAAVSYVAKPIVDPLQRPGHQPGKLTGHIPKQGGLQFQQGKAELAAKLVHDEKPLPVDFFADTTRSEDRLLVPAFSSRRRSTRCTAWAVVTAHLSLSIDTLTLFRSSGTAP